ncbi:MAG: hypothetical protein DRJ09_11730 [Bacteroidetes bacterium]|nr:MAG: hypothetical protein DRJ09_11730 [Bacteroidota bacterium]
MSNRIINNSNDKKERVSRSQHFTFIIFIIVSAIFWLLIKLSQEYSETYNMSITYQDVPNNKLLTQKIDSTVKFNITARGFYLLELSMLHPEELVIHLKNYTIHKSDENVYYISTLPLNENIAKLLDIDPSLISFSKNTLSFKLEKLVSKQVNVVSKINVTFEGSYNLYKPITIKPSKVTVYGSQTGLDTIHAIYTKAVELTNIKENTMIDIALENPNTKLFRLNPDKVKMSLEIAKFTQSKVVIPISTNGGRYQIETFPKMDTIYFIVALKDFERVSATQFMVSPEISGVNLKEANKLLLKVTKHPDFVKNIRTEPTDVEFILLK